MAEEVYFDEYSGRYFMSTADRIKEVQDKVNTELEETIKNAEKKGSITIPRGLTDEEVLAMYHDKKVNEELTKHIIDDAHYRAIEMFLEELGFEKVPHPQWYHEWESR